MPEELPSHELLPKEEGENKNPEEQESSLSNEEIKVMSMRAEESQAEEPQTSAELEQRIDKLKEEIEGKLTKEEVITLAKEVFEKGEILPFPGIKQESYLKMKAEDEEYPGFTTPIDEIIGRLKSEGMKIVLGKHPESGNVFILPAQSNDIETDSILIDRLLTNEELPENVRKIILALQR